MKFDVKNFISIIKQKKNVLLVVLWTVPCVLAVALFFEYRYFHNQVYEFEVLREDYNNYLLTMKKNFDVASEEEEEPLTASRNSGKIVSSKAEHDDDFIVLSRSTQYLRDSACAYAQAQKKNTKFLQQICSLYDDGIVTKESVGYGVRGKRHMRRTRVRRRHLSYATQHRDQVLAEPVVKEAFFGLPIPRGKFWLSSPFGPRRKRNGVWGFHRGIDMAAGRGTPVRAAAAGQVVEACIDGGYGKTVVVAHSSRFKTRYAHLDKILVKEGQCVDEGMVIGRVGATGAVRGRDPYHLHFEVCVYGKHVNPFYYLR